MIPGLPPPVYPRYTTTTTTEETSPIGAPPLPGTFYTMIFTDSTDEETEPPPPGELKRTNADDCTHNYADIMSCHDVHLGFKSPADKHSVRQVSHPPHQQPPLLPMQKPMLHSSTTCKHGITHPIGEQQKATQFKHLPDDNMKKRSNQCKQCTDDTCMHKTECGPLCSATFLNRLFAMPAPTPLQCMPVYPMYYKPLYTIPLYNRPVYNSVYNYVGQNFGQSFGLANLARSNAVNVTSSDMNDVLQDLDKLEIPEKFISMT